MPQIQAFSLSRVTRFTEQSPDPRAQRAGRGHVGNGVMAFKRNRDAELLGVSLYICWLHSNDGREHQPFCYSY